MRTCALVFLLLLSFSPLWAQPTDPSTDPDVPITGIEILVAAGGALGLRSLLAKRKGKE